MKVRVRVGGQSYEVEVGDLSARPIIATIGGDSYEVWPESEPAGAPAPASPRPVSAPAADSATGPAVKTILAPLPGVIASVAVQVGSDVAVGAELCVLEAMKMNNVIRSPRAGKIGAVHVAPGQTVKHHDILVEFVA
jgi:propionyl-CoA carboxylase alpha chain